MGLAAGLCLASVSFGQLTLDMVSGSADSHGDNVVVNGIDTYDSPYQMSLSNGAPTVNSLKTTVAMFCDDAADDVFDGEYWQVTSLTLAGITGAASPTNPPQYGSDGSSQTYGKGVTATSDKLTQAEKYIAAVDLAVQIQQLVPDNPTARGDLSLALWDVMNPVLVNSSLTAAANTDVQNAIKLAISDAGQTISEIAGYNATVYTPKAGTQVPVGDPAPQEFIALNYVPEPSSLAALGFDFVGAGIVGLYFLRRKSRARS